MAQRFSDCLSQKQFGNFCRYVFGLMGNEEGKNIQDINSAYLEVLNQATLNNFMTESPWDSEKIRDRRIALIHELIDSEVPQRQRVLFILDDIVIPKTGHHMQDAGYFRSTTLGKTVWAHNFVSSFLVAGSIRCCVDIWLYRKKCHCQASGKPFRKKTDAAADLIRRYAPLPNREYVLTMDTFYLCKKVLRPAKSRGWHWVSKLKSDRHIFYHKEEMQVRGLFAKRRDSFCYRRVSVGKKAYYAAAPLQVYLPGVGKIKLIFAIPPGQDKAAVEAGDKTPEAYACDALQWSKATILAIYSARACIDNGYRDQKQNVGLHEYQMRKGNGILKHAELVFTVHPMLLLMNANRPPDRRLRTLGEICRWVKKLRDRESTKWIYEQARTGESLDKIMETLGLV